MIHPEEKLPTIKQLQCFIAVADELNFRRAAERMSMTQPPLTRQIQCLEDVIGSHLFTRDTHQVHLTEVGLKLDKQARQLIDQLSQVMKGLKVVSDRVKIGMTRTLDFTLIPTINTHLQKLIDADDIFSYQLTSKQLLHILELGNLDIVLTGEKPAGNLNDFVFHWLHQEPLMLAMPSAHPASIQERVSLQDVADLSLYWFNRSANPSFYDKCETVFQGLPFTLKRKPDDSLLTLAHVSRGEGMALMPKSMCLSSRKGLCYRCLDAQTGQKLNIDVYMVTRKGKIRAQVLAAVEQLLAGVASEPFEP
ncbi:LysR family transcriptional regulator [Sodalis sp. RH22]|uniref:LysR family transcriptional regulator n=1 Tax=unclassified Sodalis (in: enterobacteria) TaxID=2636512 RepID=UPI0039B4839D